MNQYHLVLKAAFQYKIIGILCKFIVIIFINKIFMNYFHEYYFHELKMGLSFLLFLAKPYSVPSEGLVKWELEVMHIKVGDKATQQCKLLNQAQSKDLGQVNIGDPSFLTTMDLDF